MKKYTTRDVDRLAERLRNDMLEAEDCEVVRDMIRHHPSARRRLVEHLYFSSEIKEAIANQSANLMDFAPAGAIRKRTWIPALGLAAAAMVTLMVWQPWQGPKPAPVAGSEQQRAASALDSVGIAVISRNSGVVWGPGTTLSLARLESGLPVGRGVLELLEGVTQIDFYSGATVILEGPARIRLESPELSRLDYGNLWAKVPPPARGFRVESTSFDVVDLGTEFGMNIGPDGRGEVHVIDGEVEVFSAVKRDRTNRLLRTGEGMEIAVDGTSVDIKARPDDFLGSDSLSLVSEQNFARWKDFQEMLLQDPDMLVGYTFPEVASWGREVVNRAATGTSETSGAIVGCELVEGRWAGKGALQFRNSSHRLRLNLPGEYESVTLSCWIRVDEFAQRKVPLLHGDTMQERFVHWTLVKTEAGGMHLHFSETGPGKEGRPERIHYHCNWNLLGTKGSALGEWMHLAVVYDPVQQQVLHYQNGKLVGSSAIESPRVLGIGTGDIGNWPYHEWAKGTEWEERNLNGAIDEFIIMKRAFSPDEVRTLWEAGRP